jgi:hypothetical protein
MHDEQMRQKLIAERMRRERKAPGVIRMVVGNLMAFVEVTDGDSPIGLAFRPEHIVGYDGQPLAEIGVVIGAPVTSVTWDPETQLVSSVTLAGRKSAELRGA